MNSLATPSNMNHIPMKHTRLLHFITIHTWITMITCTMNIISNTIAPKDTPIKMIPTLKGSKIDQNDKYKFI